jgi:hypothetical protein
MPIEAQGTHACMRICAHSSTSSRQACAHAYADQSHKVCTHVRAHVHTRARARGMHVHACMHVCTYEHEHKACMCAWMCTPGHTLDAYVHTRARARGKHVRMRTPTKASRYARLYVHMCTPEHEPEACMCPCMCKLGHTAQGAVPKMLPDAC